LQLSHQIPEISFPILSLYAACGPVWRRLLEPFDFLEALLMPNSAALGMAAPHATQTDGLKHLSAVDRFGRNKRA